MDVREDMREARQQEVLLTLIVPLRRRMSAQG